MQITEFSGDLKKEYPNNEESVLSDIKIGMKEPAEEIVIKTSDSLEMAELNPDPVPDSHQDKEDIDSEK